MSTPKLKSERLILRAIKSNDIFGYSEIFSDEETMQLFGGPTKRSDLEMVDVVSRMRKERENNISFFWSIVPKDNLEFAGFIRLMNYQSKYFDSSFQAMGAKRNSNEFMSYINRNGWETDYALLKRFRGQGIMSEALKMVINFTKDEGLSPIYAKVNSIENKATIGVLMNNRFQDLLPQMNEKGGLGMIYKFE